MDIDVRRTQRLMLRRVLPTDLAHVVEADPEANRFRPGGPPSADECAEDLQTYLAVWDQHGVGYWLVEREGEVVGLAGVRPLRLAGRQCWNLYYRLRPSAWGHGYAQEAARDGMRVAGDLAPDRPIIARTGPDNLPSQRVAERLGLVHETRLDGDGYVVFTHNWESAADD